MTHAGEPKISDFGLSRMTYYSQERLLTSTRDGRGTVLFMAPELFGIEADTEIMPTPASDMWAYGMIIYVSLYFLMSVIPILLSPNIIGNCHKKAALLPHEY